MSAEPTTSTVSSAAPSALTRDQRRLAMRTLVIVLSGVLLFVALLIGLSNGSQSIPVEDVIQALRDRASVSRSVGLIVHEVRLPRVLTGALVGWNLALSGVLLQGVVRSPLGDPYILGVSAGGGLAAAIMTLRVADFEPIHLPFMDIDRMSAVPMVAFAGALCGALIVYAIAWDGTGVTTTRLALTGVAVTTMINALTTTVVVMSVQGGAQIFFQWLVGGLYTAGWMDYDLVAPYALIGFILALLLSTRANILALGDEVAVGLGLNVERTRLMMSLVAAILAGSAVAAAGLIAFVGLLVPYVARKLVGSDFRYLIPTSAILGAALVVFSDTVASVTLPRLLIDPETSTQFPVGIITAVVGGPLFLWLVRARRSQW
ncbi:MAG: iron ABC transporter permease [Anaerolineae bacterium]|nr:iron ABC transporter permease [Anaerolineae bacterium]